VVSWSPRSPRALQGGADDWFRLRALAPISGAYDLRGVELPALTDGTVLPPWNVGYTAYLMVSWNRLHHLYGMDLRTVDQQIADWLAERLPATLVKLDAGGRRARGHRAAEHGPWRDRQGPLPGLRPHPQESLASRAAIASSSESVITIRSD
jgi:hypothetical protein